MNLPDSPSENTTPEDREGGSRRQGRGGGGPGGSGPRIVGRRPGRPGDGTPADQDRRGEGDEPRAESARPREEQPADGAPSRRAPRRRRGAASEQPAASETRTTEREPRRTAPQPEPEEQPSTDGRRRQRGGGQDGASADTLPGFEGMLKGIQQSIDALTERVARAERRLRLGVFVDVPNLIYGAERSEQPINVGKLLDFLSEGRDLVRATAYSPVSDNPQEPVAQQKFVAPFVPYEYRIVTKPLKRFADGSIKGNFDVEMAIDMVTMAERLDVIAIVSGDADFARVVEVIQGRGVRVEVAAFQNSTSAEMRAIADHYTELGAIARQLR